MAIDRGLVKAGSKVQRNSDKLQATVTGVFNDVVQLAPSAMAIPTHRHEHSAKQRQPPAKGYAHTTQLTVPMAEFLNDWSSPSLTACKHTGIRSSAGPVRCPYCGQMVQS